MEITKEIKCPKCGGLLDNSLKNKFVCFDCLREYRKVNLRAHNKIKYCTSCRESVEIIMIGTEGYCLNCNTKLYTLKQS